MAVCDYYVSAFNEFVQVSDDLRVVEVGSVKGRLVDNDGDAFGFDAFHDSLNCGLPEII